MKEDLLSIGFDKVCDKNIEIESDFTLQTHASVLPWYRQMP
jgi:hypothetical protein